MIDTEKEIAEIILQAENGPLAQAMIRTLCQKVREEAIEEVANTVRDCIFVNDDLHEVRRVIQEDICCLKESSNG